MKNLNPETQKAMADLIARLAFETTPTCGNLLEQGKDAIGQLDILRADAQGLMAQITQEFEGGTEPRS